MSIETMVISVLGVLLITFFFAIEIITLLVAWSV